MVLVSSGVGVIAFILNREAYSPHDLGTWAAGITTVAFPGSAGFVGSDLVFEIKRKTINYDLSDFLQRDLLSIVGRLLVGLVGSAVLWLVFSQNAPAVFELWGAALVLGVAAERIMDWLK
jgi:DMSO reductase anchor subunit